MKNHLLRIWKYSCLRKIIAKSINKTPKEKGKKDKPLLEVLKATYYLGTLFTCFVLKIILSIVRILLLIGQII
jgi:hypothetical protein